MISWSLKDGLVMWWWWSMAVEWVVSTLDEHLVFTERNYWILQMKVEEDVPHPTETVEASSIIRRPTFAFDLLHCVQITFNRFYTWNWLIRFQQNAHWSYIYLYIYIYIYICMYILMHFFHIDIGFQHQLNLNRVGIWLNKLAKM